MSHWAAWIAAAVLVTSSLRASAQQYELEPPSSPPSQAQLERARAVFIEGTRDVEAGRWSDALERFQQAYQLSGVPAALFNVGTTLRSMGRHREARDAFDLLLERHPDLDADTAQQARERRAEEAERVAVIELAGLAGHAAARVYLDDRLRARGGELSIVLESDPGLHALRVDEEGFSSWRRDLALSDGAQFNFDVTLEPLPAAPVHESGWFWVVFGVVVAGVAAVAIPVGLYLHDEAQLRPPPGFDEHVIEL